MARSSGEKKNRQALLLDKINSDPFSTDDELAEMFCVSVPTIRLDRLKLGIPEYRERIKSVAAENHEKVKSLHKSEIIGEIIDLKLGASGISMIEVSDEMAFEKTKIIKGHYIYSLAENLAIAVIDADVALVGVANIKYKIPVYSGSKIIAKAEVKKNRSNNYFVWVKIFEKSEEVFRGKFILVIVDKAKYNN